ncbi:MAG: aminotransferase class IV [Eubacteriales bacterium]|nr:aminotransferase class IV [Eubacteriales bacterium]
MDGALKTGPADNAGKYFILNGVTGEASGIPAYDENSGLTAYEVVRVIKRKPLFFEDHMNRMDRSLSAVGYSLKDAFGSGYNYVYRDRGFPEDDFHKGRFEALCVAIAAQIQLLAEINGLQDFNIKITAFPEQEGKFSSMIYIKKSKYPSPDEIMAGVKARTALIERVSPNAKIERADYKARVAEAFASDPDAYEILLRDRKGFVTEGSKSNLFTVIGETVVTAPGEQVLKGITRQYIFEACKRQNIKTEEKPVSMRELLKADGLFISGTSIKVLPVSYVDGIRFMSPRNNIIKRISQEYEKIINEYLDSRII